MNEARKPRVLKADSARSLGTRVVFDYDDLQKQGEALLDRARAEAAEIVRRAESEADDIRRRAHEDAQRDGRAAGLREAEAEVAGRVERLAAEKAEERLQTALPALHEVVEALRQERAEWRSVWEADAVGLAVAIAEKIVQRTIATDPEVTRDVLARALELAAGSSTVEVRLHPRDVEGLGASAEELVRSLSECGSARIVPDEQVSPGGCLVRTDQGTIDGRTETQLERITAELLGED